MEPFIKSEQKSASVELTEDKCYKILEKLVKNPNSWPFRSPVKPEEWGILDYFDVIKEPMDLGTVSDKLSQTDISLRRGPYADMSNFIRDIKLVWSNCKTYNTAGSDIWTLADEMEKEFEYLLAQATGSMLEKKMQLSATFFY